MDEAESKRRPIKTRDSRWARSLSRFLLERGATPNGVSLASMGFAFVGGGAWYLAIQGVSVQHRLLYLGALAGMQLRLVCNLIDGMLAVEGGLKSPVGDLYNEAPDRVSDTVVVLGVGYGLAAAGAWYGAELGWATAFFAMATAYVRVLGASAGAGHSFAGPMAKQHRMALLSGTAVVGACAPSIVVPLTTGILGVILIGSAATVLRRLRSIARSLLRSRHPSRFAAGSE